MSAHRGLPEFYRRMSVVLASTVPCPDCGLDLPSADHDARQAHFAICTGKPKTTATVINFTAMPLTELNALRLCVRARLLVDQNKRPGEVPELLQITFLQILDAIDDELTRRTQGA